MGAEIKGTTIQSRLDYIAESWGPTGKAEAMASLKGAFGEEVAGLILPMSWYPLSMDDHLCRFIQEKSGDSSDDLFRRLGEVSARKHHTYFRKILGERRDPPSFLDAITHFHNTYDRGLGTMVLDRREEREADLKIERPAEGYRSHCASTVAYILETYRLITREVLRAEEPSCKALGKRDCIWRFRW